MTTTMVRAWRLLRCAGAVALWLWLGALALTLVLLAALWVIGWRADVVRTGSMAPALPVDSRALISPVASRDIRPGDVIRFRPRDAGYTSSVLHRVVAVESSRGGLLVFRTQGDANATPDPRAVYGGQIEGRLELHVPRLGGVLALARQPSALALLTGLPLVAGLAAELAARRRRRAHGDAGLVAG